MRRGLVAKGAALALALALATLSACAPIAPPPQPPPAPAARPATPATKPAAGTTGTTSPPSTRPPVPVGNTASGGSIHSRGIQPTVVDSGPSAEALAVLATIPEPIAVAERVPPPANGASGSVAPAPQGTPAGAAPGISAPAAPATPGSSATPAPSAPLTATDSSAVLDSTIPVPAPTEPLGDKPGTLAKVLADTIPAAPPPPPPAAPPAKAEPDSCWRIQIAAPTASKEADLKRQAAESVLLVPFEIEPGKTRFKVRSRDCLSRQAADRLRGRAIGSGFAGAFLVLEVKKK